MRQWVLAAGIWLALAMPNGAAASEAPGPSLRAVALKHAEFGLAEGDAWGRAGGEGIFCKLNRKPLKWKPDQVPLRPAKLAALFKDALSGAGLASGDLFVKSESRDRLQVGAVIKGLDADLCHGGPQGRSHKAFDGGVLGMTIAWQVFDPAKGEMVLRIETQGEAREPKTARDGLDHLITHAFQTNARQLAADARFRALVLIPAAEPAAAATASPPAVRSVAEGPEPVLTARRAVVRISTDRRRGTGVLASTDGAVLTTRAAVGAAQFVTVTWLDGREAVGEVIATDLKRNLALVRADRQSVPPLTMRRGKVPVGEPVFVLDPVGDASSVRPGTVAALRTLDGAGYLQTPLGLSAEDSGAALVDAKGAVIGLSVGAAEPGALPAGVSLFIRAGDALDLLRARTAVKPRRKRR